jgi:hypothetical protein
VPSHGRDRLFFTSLFGFGSFVGVAQWSEEVFWFAVLYMMFIGPVALIPWQSAISFSIELDRIVCLRAGVPGSGGALKFRVIMPSSELLIISAISAAVLVHQGIFKLFDLDAASRDSS